MDIKVPAVGESIFEALIARWLRKGGERVVKDEPLCEIETDKVTLEVNAEAEGVLSILAREGETVKIGAVIGTIDEKGAEARPEAEGAGAKPEVGAAEAKPEAGAAEARPVTEAAREPEPAAGAGKEPQPGETIPPMSPSGRKLAREMGVETRELKGSGRGGRVTREDLLRGEPAQPAAPSQEPSAPSAVEGAAPPAPARGAVPQPAQEPAPEPAPPRAAVTAPPAAPQAEPEQRVTRKPMTPIRRRIAERLVSARQQTAMLTTFNEADLTEVLRLRKKHGEYFLKRHNVKLGFMSLFVRACCQALQEFPEVNASIEGDDVVYHNFCDIGVAVGGEKGLVVPVLRGAESLTLAEIEQQIAGFAEKIRTNRLAIADLEGGTFTVSNGGVYGSLLSTPILNPPQSGVLGMHAIQDRAVVRDREIVIRPMMYLALSYDHRIVDGRGAVGFLKRVKEYIEEPEEMLLEA
ncbi:MAG: dihydrolipoamide succinyltransferase [Geobacteraceae bacterium GWC2_58_44]|nr:MAG: dihydrolipoamide succinyltransferase [Geobacteraceae bacterium GWC2_58_44]